MPKRRRFKHTTTLEERLVAFAEEAEARALTLPPGPEKDAADRKAHDAQVAANIDGWLRSPGLRPPT